MSAQQQTSVEQQAGAITPDEMREKVVEQIRTVYDPEIPVNIFELGLIYNVDVTAGMDVLVEMTLTSPNCPAAQSMPAEVEQKVRSIDGIGEVVVEVVWDPPWSQEHMSEAARLELGIM